MKNNMELALNAVPERSGVMNDELELICKATTKNSDAFIQITDSVKDKLYHTAYVILGTEADACDAVDETMYKAWRNIHKLRQPEYFTTWITRILINESNKILKHRKRELPYEYMPESSGESFDGLPIREAVECLPTELKIIVSLRYFSDMTVPEVAKTLSIPEGTVKSRQRKALSLLKLDLEDDYNG